MQAKSLEVFIAEGSPALDGHRAARALTAHPKSTVSTTVIPDAAVFAIMPRMHRVVLGAAAITASGGVVAPAGCFAVALAASQAAVPVIVVASSLKVCRATVGSH